MTSEPFDIVPALAALDLYEPTPGDYSGEMFDTMSDFSDLSDISDHDDHEDGEISEDEEHKDKKTGKQKRNKYRYERKRARKAHRREEKAEELRKAEQKMRQVLAAIYQYPVDQVHLHTVRRNDAALKKLQEREVEKSGPLAHADVDELVPTTKWMHEPGLHLGLLSERGRETVTIVFAVKIRPWQDMQSTTCREIQSTLETVMDWGDQVYDIKNNAAAKGASHGVRGGKQNFPMTKPRGVMYGIGWHLSQEAGKTLVAYAPKNKDPKSLAIYSDLNAKLPEVSALYRHGLSCLFPGGAAALQDVADQEGVLAFADALDGTCTERPFANSLTATKLGFCNYLHRDADLCPIAYGMWFGARLNADGRWTFSPDADHHRTKGGQFLWGQYGVGVDFEKAHGLVEIYWRGQLDYHGTLESIDELGFTRFGTSIQITRKGVNAMQKVWNVEELAKSGHDVHRLAPKTMARITTAQDRIIIAQANIERRERKKRKIQS